MADDAPKWLRTALAAPVEEDEITVSGCAIHRMAWGDREQPGLVLIHGGAGHAHWWSFIAPLFPQYRVVALDLSGHGDSGRRSEYSVDDWTEEVLAAAQGEGMEGPPVVIGHSMGGFVATATAVKAGTDIAGMIILDSPIVAEDAEVEAARLGQAFGAPKIYPDVETAIARFRTVPRQENYDPFILRHVAEHSLRSVDGGFSWKFDPALFRAVSRTQTAELLPKVSGRVALIRSEFGLVTAHVGAIMYEALGRVAPVVEIPLAGHHMMLDQPLSLVTALRAILADWEHSVPFPRQHIVRR
ncbi:MAG: alpha/beta hydrolase [Candidatus Binatia bacterium]|nr:alpha/beta hydrolase [Candidatus Binatia bacterium]